MVRDDHGGHPEAGGQDQGRAGGAAKDRRGPRNEAHLKKSFSGDSRTSGSGFVSGRPIAKHDFIGL